MSIEAMKQALGELQAGKVGNAMQILREALAEQPASNVNATGGPKAFFSVAEQPAPPGWIDELAKVPDNAWPAQQQEPVAVFDEQLGRPKMLSNAPMLTHGQGLYTSPPASKPWVGLTVDEFYDLDDVGRKMILEYGRAVEAKLREKNA